MKKLTTAIIGQGRSGKNIHGRYFLSENNTLYDIKYVVDFDEQRRKKAETLFPGCVTFDNYKALLDIEDIDLVVNASFSQDHYSVTKDLLAHGKNVLVEKPMARTRYECDDLIKTAKEQGVVLAVFQQTFLAPMYLFTRQLADSGILGHIEQISICYNGFSRRWDWQTLQKNCAGSAYNTGPHPIGLALGFLDFDPDARVIYSRLANALTSGDSDDYAKILLTAPGKPLVDVEISSIDAYSGYNIKIMGSRGTYTCNTQEYQYTYIVEGENPAQPVIEQPLQGENGEPVYCSEKLIKHTESGKFDGDAFGSAPANFYDDLYHKIVDGKALRVTPEMAAQIISVIETAHAQNPLPRKF